MTVWALITPPGSSLAEANTIDAIFRIALGGTWPADGELHALNATRWILAEGFASPAATHGTVAALLAAHPGDAPDLNIQSQNSPVAYWVGALALRASGWVSLRWDVAVLLLRVINIALLAPLPLLVSATARQLLGSPVAAATASVLLFAVPQLAETGGTVSPTAAATLLSAVAVWLGVRLVTGERSWWSSVALACTAGFATAISFSGLLVAVFALVCIASTRGRGVRRLATDIALIIVISGVGIIAVVQQYLVETRRFLTGTANVSNVIPQESTFGNAVDAQWTGLSTRFWGGLGRDGWLLTSPLVAILTVGSLAVLSWALLRREPSIRRAWPLLTWAGIVLASLLLTGILGGRVSHVVLTGDGQGLDVAVTALVAAVAVAARSVLTSPRQTRRAVTVALVGSPLIAAYGMSVAYQGVYEASHFAVSTSGLSTMAAVSPFGAGGIASAGLILAAATVTAWVVAVRAVRCQVKEEG
ncbi:hypothetical protein [Curtobacterium sp. SL109]|uniref:hypothetical protein n=1 Tax=Curtobacterium sp. SL109 TaxID=2994662 RepID=UPI00227517F0|nr:hypothetical protein [Curtobacterium sp. SL109]MCY1692887.1 hypothetical protein [Curtobacterium sp. SL109]